MSIPFLAQVPTGVFYAPQDMLVATSCDSSIKYCTLQVSNQADYNTVNYTVSGSLPFGRPIVDLTGRVIMGVPVLPSAGIVSFSFSTGMQNDIPFTAGQFNMIVIENGLSFLSSASFIPSFPTCVSNCVTTIFPRSDGDCEDIDQSSWNAHVVSRGISSSSHMQKLNTN
mgnify:CR=1 FL=1